MFGMGGGGGFSMDGGSDGGGGISGGSGSGSMGGIEIIGDIFGGVMGYIGDRETNATNEKIAADNRRWQEMMSGSAYARAMADMRASGLNPMLAYSQGGASTPAGSTYNYKSPMSGLGEGVKRLASSALERAKLHQDVRQVESNIGLTEISKMKAAADTQQALSTAKQAEAQTQKIQTETDIARKMTDPKLSKLKTDTAYRAQQTKHEGFYTDSYKSEAQLDKKTTDLKQSTGYFTLDNVGTLFNKFFGGNSALGNLKNPLRGAGKKEAEVDLERYYKERQKRHR